MLPRGRAINAALPRADRRPAAHGRAMCEAAVTLASTGQAEAIVAMTRKGHTARLLSCLRPRAQILAVTPSPEVASRLALLWGVTPVVSSEQDPRNLASTLIATAGLSLDPVVVFINMSPDSNGKTPTSSTFNSSST